MNGTHQILAYADEVNLIGDDIRTIETNADVLLNACKDIDKKCVKKKERVRNLPGYCP